ncbi:MAG TPA: hypothetical protein VKU00_19910 [Chthonomonadaceae bacterium]|nr:hypothetical protein [Chthonomonadaceae bacterium]
MKATFQPANIPEELKRLPQWVCFRLIPQPGKKDRKTPINAHTGAAARSHDKEETAYSDRAQDTWATFEQARAGMRRLRLPVVGFALSDPYFGNDLDHCVNPDTLEIAPWAQAILKAFPTYTEFSPSLTGIKLIGRGKKPGDRCRTKYETGEIEIYDHARFFTLTGCRVPGAPSTLHDCQAALNTLYSRLFPARPCPPPGGVRTSYNPPPGVLEIIQKASTSRGGAKFGALMGGDWQGLGYESQSQADLALCGAIAFYAGPDEGLIDSVFRSSGLLRDKWDERRGRSTYGRRTIARALDERTQFYQWPGPGLRPYQAGDHARKERPF